MIRTDQGPRIPAPPQPTAARPAAARCRTALGSALLFAVAACGGGNGAAVDEAVGSAVVAARTGDMRALATRGRLPAVETLTLPAVSQAVQGAPLQLGVSALDASGAAAAPGALTWTVEDTEVATVDARGMAAPGRAGSTAVTVRAGNLTATTALTVRAAAPIPARSRYVGTNLAGIAYWSTEFPFVDLMKTGSGWDPRDSSGGSTGAFPGLTSDGYPASLKPGQRAVAAVAWMNTHYPSGRYVVLWDGDGTIGFDASPATVAETGTNRIAVDVVENGSALWVAIVKTNPKNPVRNLRFLMPGSEPTHATRPFNPEFLARTAAFSNLRFMDWGQTNGSPVVQWTDRARVADLQYGARGVPIERMIDLANTLQVDPWFCIPHRASDAYVRAFAMLVKSRLDPRLRAHVEYSNEVWNTGFPQTTWAREQATALGLPSPYGQPSAFYAQRSAQISAIVDQVFGAAARSRTVRVIAGQFGWSQFLESALGWKDTAAHADVMAVAPYFTAPAAADPTRVEATLVLKPEQIVDQMQADVRGNIRDAMVANAALAKRHGLVMKAYESGAGDTTAAFPADKRDAVTALFAAANRHPRMRDLMNEFYGFWVSSGGDTMNHYNDVGNWSMYGFWGALEYIGQPAASAPKYQALLDFIAAHPTGASTPATAAGLR
jgi:hypothetical protein